MPTSSDAHQTGNSARWRNELPALLAISLFFILFFGWIWMNRIYLVGGDAFAYSYPLRSVAWRLIREGELPLWTTSILSGYPLLSMSQVALGYPLTWFYLILPGYIAEEIFVLTPFLMAPLFTYLYVRVIGLSRTAALLASLSYGYGGMTIGLLGVVGIMPHALLWLPLMLVALERARTSRFIPCLILATAAFGLSLLTGLAQGFLFVGLIALSYAVFLTLCVPTQETKTVPAHPLDRFRPLGVCLLGCLLGTSLGAWQFLETLRAADLSIRSTLIYPFFVSGSFAPLVAFKSLVAPLYTERFADVSTYVAPIVVLLAVYALISVLGHRTERADRDPRIFFWAAVAIVACVLILGKYTPVYRGLYYVPIFKLFRVPSRHTFEWTFAISVLAAYGWDTLRKTNLRILTGRAHSERVLLIVAVCLLFLSVMLSFGWLRATGIRGLFAFSRIEGAPQAWAEGVWYSGLPLSRFLIWKALFTVTTIATLWCVWQNPPSPRNRLILVATLLLTCFVEPFIVVRNWWQPFAKTSGRFSTPSLATSWLRTNLKSGRRIYPRLELFTDEFTETPRVDPPNLTMLHGLPSAAGYEPLLLTRYSRALGNVTLDASTPLPGFNDTNELFKPQSHVLDLLSTQFVVTYDNPSVHPDTTIEKDGFKFEGRELLMELHGGESAALSGHAGECDTLALVTSLANSTQINDGAPIARVRVFTRDHRTIDFNLRAGQETAEWAHERPDVRSAVKHKLAPVFDSTPLNSGDKSYPGNRYWTQLPLGMRSRIDRIEVTVLNQEASLAVWKVTLFDTLNRVSYPLGFNAGDLLPRIDVHRWHTVFDQDGVFIFENQRVLARAWLVGEAVSVDADEALRQIRGEGERRFDPERTALLEVPRNELPQLPGGLVASSSRAQVVSYSANRVLVKTDAPTATVLILSEMFYPGWDATVDGKPEPLLVTDYLLRGVAVPAGQHEIEMRYRAPSARVGAVISVFGFFSLCLLAFYSWRQRVT